MYELTNELLIPELMKPKTIEELKRKFPNVKEGMLYYTLRRLCSINIAMKFKEKYQLTPGYRKGADLN